MLLLCQVSHLVSSYCSHIFRMCWRWNNTLTPHLHSSALRAAILGLILKSGFLASSIACCRFLRLTGSIQKPAAKIDKMRVLICCCMYVMRKRHMIGWAYSELSASRSRGAVETPCSIRSLCENARRCLLSFESLTSSTSFEWKGEKLDNFEKCLAASQVGD